MSSRFLIVAPIALLITGALFFLMRDLISGKAETPEIEKAPVVEIGRKVEEKKVPDPPVIDPNVKEPDAPPPTPDFTSVPTGDPTFDGEPFTGIDPNPGRKVLTMDGDARAIIVPLEYPPCGRGTGEVLLDFVVEPDGSVGDVRIVSATSSCFAKAAQRATRRWRYQAEVVDGEAVRSGRKRVKVQFVQEG